LGHISFYSGSTTASGFLGTGAFGSNHEIVPVPEPGVMIAAFMLLGCLLVTSLRPLNLMTRKI